MANKAKKSIVRYANFELKAIPGTEDSTLRVYGRNSNDTIIEINIEICDWNFPTLICQMKDIAKDKVKRAVERLDNVKAAVND